MLNVTVAKSVLCEKLRVFEKQCPETTPKTLYTTAVMVVVRWSPTIAVAIQFR